MATTRKSTVDKSATKKSTAKKSTAKRAAPADAAAKKSAPRTRKSTPTKSASDGHEPTATKSIPRARKSAAAKTEPGARRSSARKNANGGAATAEKSSPVKIARAAAGQLAELTGRSAEGITGIERTEDGWRVSIEVVESRRIPDSTDILAVYEVDVDGSGELTGYQRVRRYTRGRASEDGRG